MDKSFSSMNQNHITKQEAVRPYDLDLNCNEAIFSCHSVRHSWRTSCLLGKGGLRDSPNLLASKIKLYKVNELKKTFIPGVAYVLTTPSLVQGIWWLLLVQRLWSLTSIKHKQRQISQP